MIQRFIIIGAGGLAYDILDIIEECNRITPQWELIGFLDDTRLRGSRFHGYEILGALDDAKGFPDCKFILAIGSDKSYLHRQQLIQRTKLSRDDFISVVHPKASVSRLSIIGKGVYVSHGVAISASVRVDDHVAISPGCLVGHDSHVGEFTVVAPGACISGFVDVAPSCYIGARATIRQRVKIGEKSLVGMSAVVLRDVAPQTTVIGSPARPLIKVNAESAHAKLPRVDVIVPCYKYAHYLRACVESVLSQEGVDPRVLILDDASPDNTPEIGGEMARNDPRIEFRRHVVNQGHIPTFNEGLNWASGEFVVLLSADDLLMPGSLARATKIFSDHPRVTLIYGKAIVCDEPENSTEQISTDPSYQLIDGQKFLETACMDGGNHVPTPTAIVRTDIQKTLGGYRRELLHTGDMEMWIRHAIHGDVAVLAAHQAFYRQHGKNMSAQYRELNELQMHWLALEAIFKNYPSKIPDLRRLQEHVVRLFSKEAFYMANKAFDRGDLSECNRGLEIALSISPIIATTAAYRRLQMKKRFGPKIWSLLRSTIRPIARPSPVSL
jgi:sugar O-acyltransferase (sialic acid O-acetyltransferase NeuD family)